MFCLVAPDYDEWFAKEVWTIQEASILICGGNPKENNWIEEIQWQRKLYNNDTSLLEELDATFAILMDFVTSSNPAKYIQVAVNQGIEFAPKLYHYLLKNNKLPKADNPSIIYNHYAFWAKMDTWNFYEALHLISKLDCKKRNNFLCSEFYPNRKHLYDEAYIVLVNSMKSGRFGTHRDATKDYENWFFKTEEIIKWASEKGYEFPALLMEIMGYKNLEINNQQVAKPTTANEYTTPYIELMKQAIVELKITKDNQPKVEFELVPWFEERLKKIEGKETVNNKAKLMATFVRLPEAQSGGNKPIKNKG